MDSPGEPGPLDRAALERLYVKLEKPMFNVVYRWLWNATDAHDVVQEAFLRVWKVRERVEVETVQALLYRTALNLASNRRRSARLWRLVGVESAADEAAPELATDEALEAARRSARVRAAIDALPERLRQVIALSELAEMSYDEIAATLGIPVGTVGSRRHTALAALAKALGPIEGLEVEP
jgi:RNA polymerase sigma-70 factor, ECF subfamily